MVVFVCFRCFFSYFRMLVFCVCFHGFFKCRHGVDAVVVGFVDASSVEVVQVDKFGVSFFCKQCIGGFQSFRIVFQFVLVVHVQPFQQGVFGVERNAFAAHFERLCIVFVQIEEHGIAAVVIELRLSFLHELVECAFGLAVFAHGVVGLGQFPVGIYFIGMSFFQFQQHVYGQLRVDFCVGLCIFVVCFSVVGVYHYGLFVVAACFAYVFLCQSHIACERAYESRPRVKLHASLGIALCSFQVVVCQICFAYCDNQCFVFLVFSFQ